MKQVTKNRVEEFRSAMLAGMEGIVRAANIYVEALDEDPANADAFMEACAEFVPDSAWAQLEAVGRRWIHPRMLMGGMADRRKAALVRKLPYSLQERVFNRERFPLLVNGKDTLEVDMMEATPRQVAQLCNGGSIRSLSAQKAWLQEQAVDKTEKPETMPYTVKDGKVIFRRSVTLTRGQIKTLLQEM